MAKYKDFGSPEPIDENAKPEEIGFGLNGQNFECVPELPGAVLLDLVSKSDMKKNPAEAAAVILEFFETTLEPESYERFSPLIRNPKERVDVTRLSEIVEHLMEAYSNRPTQPPKSS